MNEPDASPFSRSVSRRFSTAAADYHAKARVQPLVAARLMETLSALPAPSHLLELGCGSGRLTRLMRQRWPSAEIDAIDVAPGMIDLCREAFADDPRASFTVADATHFAAPRTYPLIVSSCALHWLEQPERAFRNVRSALAPGGLLAFSLMLDGTLCELREARLHAAPAVPPLGRLPTLAATADVLRRAGFRVESQFEEQVVSEAPSASQLLVTLHEHGVTGGRVSHGVRPLTRRELAALSHYYDARFRTPEGAVRATYRVGYVAARGAP